MMRVAVVTPVYPHAGSPVEGLFNEKHALALKKAGVDVNVILCKPWLPKQIASRWKRYHSLAHLPAGEDCSGIRVWNSRFVQIPLYMMPHLTVAGCAHALLKAIKKMMARGALDLLQVHSVWPVGLASPVVAKKLKIPFVVTLHIQDDPQLYLNAVGSRLYRRMVAEAASLAAVGRPLASFLREHFPICTDGRLKIIPNGVDLSVVTAISATATEYPYKSLWGHILSVSNLWPIKGIDDNLKALAWLEKKGVAWRNYTVVGDGPERARLEKMATDLGIRHKVHLKGRLSHENAIAEIAKADIFSLPSWQEAFGVVYLEAMACKKPVIGCLGQGAQDIIQHEQTGLLVKPRDELDLAKALRRLLDDREFAQRLGELGAIRAREFTWDKNAAAYIELYNRILSRKEKFAHA